jgi:general secretion pathway protein D
MTTLALADRPQCRMARLAGLAGMRALAAGALLCALLAACASDNRLAESRRLLEEGQEEEALAVLEAAARERPENRRYRSEYFRQRELLAAQWVNQAELLRMGQQFERAQALYQRILRFDPTYARAKAGLAQIETDKRHRAALTNAEKLIKAEKYAEALDLLGPVLAENAEQRDAQRLQRMIEEKTQKPSVMTRELRSSITKPVSLDLKDVPLRTVFDVVGRAANLNFLFDKDVRADQRTTIAVRDAQVDEIIRLLLAINQLDQKVLNETTALIYPNTPQKQRDYQELVVRSFFLTNADARQIANLIRTILKTRDIYVDEKLNVLTMKDTPHAIRLAERLISSHDLAEPEVMLEIEVLEIASNRLLDLGLRFPSSVAWSLVGGVSATTSTPGGGTTTSTGTPGVISLPEWLNRDANLVRLTFTDPLFLLSLRQQDGSSNLLANPRVRVKNREKARIHIGDRVPVITTTSAVAGGFVSQSVNYLDVGLKLDVEPLIYLNDEVGIKVGLEVSNITNTVQTPNGGTVTYQIGTRNANTVLRLRDGETQILAGLINDEDRRTASKVPGVSELPVVGRLFSANGTTKARTEIVLLMTPRLMRTLVRPQLRAVEFSAGTESSTGGGPLSGPVFPVSPAPAPISPLPPPVQFPGGLPVPAPFPLPGPPPASTAPVPGGTPVPFGGMEAPR